MFVLLVQSIAAERQSRGPAARRPQQWMRSRWLSRWIVAAAIVFFGSGCGACVCGGSGTAAAQDAPSPAAAAEAPAAAAEAPAAAAEGDSQPLYYEDHLAALLEQRCGDCHNAEDREGQLDLSTAAGLLAGSESGPIVVPRDHHRSLLYEVIHSGEMPPDGEELSAEEIERIGDWISAGAKFREPPKSASEPPSQHDVLPILLLRCTACHGAELRRGGLDLRSIEGLRGGGEHGPAAVSEDPDASPLIQRVEQQLCPPKGDLLKYFVERPSSTEVTKLRDWIAAGMPFVDDPPAEVAGLPDPNVSDEDREHWAFRPLPEHVAIPGDSARSDAGLEPNRSVAEQPLDAFIGHELAEQGLEFSPPAKRHELIRRVYFGLHGLPPSPEELQRWLDHPGERWYEELVEHLLASPRYGERWGRYWLDVAGYADSEGGQSEDPVRTLAWKYRDYVIRAFDDDKPWDRFLSEQIAGDELADYSDPEKVTAATVDNLIATGFLRMGVDETGSRTMNFVPERLGLIDDALNVVSTGVMGLTMECARCHSHKYDPIPHSDYYRFKAIFQGAFDEHDWMSWKTRRLEVATPEMIAHREAVNEPLGIRALWDRGRPSPTYVLIRGEHDRPGRLVAPGVPAVLTDGKTPFVAQPPWPGAQSTGRRLALARWLTDADHPLTARVIVNRTWSQHFGAGIVKTLDNFGRQGADPTHPELLDWLSREFVDSGWSLKSLHRMILHSRTYRQSSARTPAGDRIDPENRWLSRMSLRRLDAEALRDSVIAISGRLDDRMFGPPSPVTVREDGLILERPSQSGRFRRSLYLQLRRTEMPSLLSTFDYPEMQPNCVERSTSTVSTQSLILMNNGRIHELAGAFADRVLEQTDDVPTAVVEQVYRTALSRPPNAAETAEAVEALTELRRIWLASGAAEEASLPLALTTFCHTVINSAEFRYVD